MMKKKIIRLASYKLEFPLITMSKKGSLGDRVVSELGRGE